MTKAKIIVLFFICLTSLSSPAQKTELHNRESRLGITFSSFGSNDVIYLQQITGAPGYTSDYFYTLGFTYLHQYTKRLELETGIEYSSHKITITPNVPPYVDYAPYSAEFTLVNIPVSLRLNFGKYFFFSGGLILDIDPTVASPIDNQTGIGAGLGLGGKYDFACGLSVFANPYLKAHSLIPFMHDVYHQRVVETGLRFGLTYSLKNQKSQTKK